MEASLRTLSGFPRLISMQPEQVIRDHENKLFISQVNLVMNKSQYWPRGAPKHAEIAENEKA